MEKNQTKKYNKTTTIEKSGKAKAKQNIKHYFAGANTGEGFYNLFDQINDPSKSGILYILKGGPGTGKSTLMKTVGKEFCSLGLDVEYFYCSSDYSSLDGVRLPQHNIAIVDGTAPHVTEATMPAIKEKIINLGEFIGSDILAHEQEISNLLKKKKMYFDLAYLYLKNATNLYKAASILSLNQNQKVNPRIASKKLVQSLDLEKIGTCGKVRRLFTSAVAGEGMVELNRLNKYSNIITLPYDGRLNGLILDNVQGALTGLGHDITCFMQVLCPQDIHSIYIPKTNTLITQNSQIAKKQEQNGVSSFNDQSLSITLKEAANSIAKAKKLHKKVEAFYIPCMNFDSITKVTNGLICEIKQSIF